MNKIPDTNTNGQSATEGHAADDIIQPVEGTVGEMLVSLAEIAADDLPEGAVEAFAALAQVIDDPSLDFLGFSALSLQERRDVAGLTFIALGMTGTGATGLHQQIEAYHAGALTMSAGADHEKVALALSRVALIVELLDGEDTAD